MRSDRARLLDIDEAVQRIMEKLPSTQEEFIQSDLLQVWVLYHIQVLGEAANGISPEFQKQHQEIPGKDIIAMRHLLVHQYFGIDRDEIWNTAKQDLPKLQQEISRMLKRG
jgi:uncharacterized protein with HEPN domain